MLRSLDAAVDNGTESTKPANRFTQTVGGAAAPPTSA